MVEFPPAIRKEINTTTATESVDCVIRKFTRNRRQRLKAESALKLFCLAIHEASKKRAMPGMGWEAGQRLFAVLFDGRMPAATGQ